MVGFPIALSLLLAQEPEAVAKEPALSDAVLESAVGERVIVSGDGEEHIGRVRAIADDSVVLVADDGELFALDKTRIESIKLTEMPAEPPPRPAARTTGYTFDVMHLHDLEVEGRGEYRAGQVVLGVGGSVWVAGAIMMAAGYSAANSLFPPAAGDRAAWERIGYHKRIAWAGTGLFVGGAVISVVGAIFYGRGRNKLRYVQKHRRPNGGTAPTAGGPRLGLVGRF